MAEIWLIKNISLQMKMNLIIIVIAIIGSVQSISQYDFNACRISNCNAEEINCLSDESGCLNYFAIMRNCFSGCGDTKNWNGCWSTCKNVAARSNAYYYSMSLCYENLCYLAQKWVLLFLSVAVLILLI